MSSGDLNPLKEALGTYLGAWYAGVYGDTPSVIEFAARGYERSVLWAPGRMVDYAEEMLKLYQKNSNGEKGANSLLPVVLIALAKEYTPTPGEAGGKQVERQIVSIVEGGSAYGYRQAMADKRAQIVIFGAEEMSANSLAAQLGLYLGAIPNRRFTASHTFGQYTFEMPWMIETPDIEFSEVRVDLKNLTVLACNLNLRGTIPYFDAPGVGEPNDGTTNNPPGYPVLNQITTIAPLHGGSTSVVTPGGTNWNGQS
jgi:hypothetical protein